MEEATPARPSESLTRVLHALEQAAAAPRASPPFERRRTVRVQCHQPLVCRRGGEAFPATAVDVSLGGMRLQLSQAVEAGDEVELLQEPGSTEAVRAVVRWYHPGNGLGGVEFLGDSRNLVGTWVVRLMGSLFGDPRGMLNRRRYIRARAMLPARLEPEGGEVLPGTLVDVGLGGGLVNAARALPPESPVRVVFGPPELREPLSLRGRVLHSQDDGVTAQHRIEFLSPTETEVQRLEELVAALLQRGRLDSPGPGHP